jgi:nitrite reductase/ring-hydroxylating ferredoxin subunit
VKSTKPAATFCGGEPIVLFRDKGGAIRALEDRCPHRRVPLSLGRVLDNGMLQCGYHGWTFDGATGRCMAIPNLKERDQIPALYRARNFSASEINSVVRVSSSADGQSVPDSTQQTLPRWHGTHRVTLDHRRYVDALLDGPGCLFAFLGVRFVDYLLKDPYIENGRVVLERHAAWSYMGGGDRLAFGDRTRSEHPLTVRFTLDAETGETDIVLRDRLYAVVATAMIAPVPAGRDTTTIFWQCNLGEGGTLRSRLFRAVAGVMGSPFTVFESIDAKRLGGLMIGPSQQVMRNSLAPKSAPQAL